LEIHVSITTLILICLGASCLLISGLFSVQEIGEVNRKLPADEQISYWGMYAEKASRIKQQYKRLYPDGRLHRLRFIFEIIGFLLLLSALITSRFFGHLIRL
jgi:hypothetical protein